jgi:modulator of FtsH protease HflK
VAWNQPNEDKPRPPPRGAPDDSSLDEMLRRWQQRVQRLWRPGSGRGTAALALLLLAAAVWLASGYYQIDAFERGVVQRFGRMLTIEQPGHGWHWPWPLETMQKVNVGSIQSLESKALMLTADQSLIQISWALQYRINDPVQYLYQVREPQLTLGRSGETLVRELVAQYELPALLSGEARGRVTSEARGRIQQAMDDYRTGITVTGVNLTDVQLPDAALATQRDAEKAAEDRQRTIADAQAYANDIVPKAQAAAQRQLADAQVYAAQTVANADGEAERFTQLAAAYAQAPDATRSRLYIDTMQTILSRSRKIVIDAKTGSGSMIYLPLDKLAEAVRAATPAVTPAGAAAGAGAAATGTAAAGAPAPPAAVSGAAASGERADQADRGRERGDR